MKAAAWAVVDADDILYVSRFRHRCQRFAEAEHVGRVVPLHREPGLDEETRKAIATVAHKEHDMATARVLREFLQRA